MARRSKRYKKQGVIRAILASNVRALRDHSYRAHPTDTSRNRALARDADTTLSQIQRILAGSVGIGIDLLEAIAQVFGVRPQDLITPYFAADPSHTSPEGTSADTGLHRRPKRA